MKVVEGEPLAGPAETRHDLIGHEHNPVLRGELPDAFEVPGRWEHDAGRPRHGFEDDRRELGGALQQDHLFEVLQGARGLLLRRRRMEVGAVQVGREEVDHAGIAVVVRDAPGVAREVHREVRATVVGAVRGQHLVTPGVQAGHADGMFHRLGSPIGEEHLVHARRRQFRDQAGRLRAGIVHMLRRYGAELRGLLLDGGHHSGVLVADIREDELRGEIEQPVAVDVPHPRALRLGDGHRVDELLRRPGVEHVLPVQFVGPASVGKVLLAGAVRYRHIGGDTHGSSFQTGSRALFLPTVPWKFATSAANSVRPEH